jgi:hypothetical protein
MICPTVRGLFAAISIGLAPLVAGCAASTQSADPSTSKAVASAEPVPKVQDCGIVTISTPCKYICNGKTYTTYQLTKLRMDEEKKYASGK